MGITTAVTARAKAIADAAQEEVLKAVAVSLIKAEKEPMSSDDAVIWAMLHKHQVVIKKNKAKFGWSEAYEDVEYYDKFGKYERQRRGW